MNSLVMKILGGALAALALLLVIQDRNHWKAVASDRNIELTRILDATREAADEPKLERAGVVRQIVELGRTIATTAESLNRQNAKVRQLAAETAEAKAKAAVAFEEGQKRAGAAIDARQRLEASARSPERVTNPCEFSPDLKDAWR